MEQRTVKDIASVPVPVELKPVEEEFDDLAEQLRIANVLCDAVDMIGEFLLLLHSPCCSDGVSIGSFFFAYMF